MNPTILVVEDVPAVRELLEITLRFKGYTVSSAADGEEALQKIAAQRPDLIVTDILMPRLDGFALVQRLRRDAATRAIPIVFISATYVAPEDKEFALSLGAVRFLEKPIDAEEFLLTIAEVLHQQSTNPPPPMDDDTFYRLYRERLQNKLRYKNRQIARLERLLPDLPEGQRPSYQAMLAEARRERDAIRAELDSLPPAAPLPSET